ncbi:MAG TPA: outer membrane beta-barrel protein [Candidatus Anammoximicrobium sp.]|nr:outer membrane beta-barrel protein [Candidatus Anammoximicrobium sp.]
MKGHFFLTVLAAFAMVTAGGLQALAGDGDGCADGNSDVKSVYDVLENAKCDEDCSGCYAVEEEAFCHYLPQVGRLQFYGWLDAGFVGNTSSPNSRFNGPYNAVDRSNELMFNQGYLVSEIGLPRDGSVGVGGRLDLLYGEDFLLAQSVGWELNDDGTPGWNGHEYYGLAMPQAYIEAGTCNLSVKIGHFYSIVGYEGVMAPYNFFYSKSYSYQFAGPFQHWGGQVDWQLNEAWQVQAGLINGWNALDREQDTVNFIGRVKYTNPDRGWWTSFALITGDEYNNVANLTRTVPADQTNRTRYSWIVDLPITCRWEYVFHHWLGYQEAGAADGSDADWYGLDQYLYYTINECWKVGGRLEWFRDEEGTRVGLNRPSNPNNPPFVGDFWSLSVGANWTPTTNLIVRPELRWDWFDGVGLPYADGAKDDQLLLAADVIWRF